MPDAAFTVVLVVGFLMVVVFGFALSGHEGKLIPILISWQGLNTLLSLYVAVWCYKVQSHRREEDTPCPPKLS